MPKVPAVRLTATLLAAVAFTGCTATPEPPAPPGTTGSAPPEVEGAEGAEGIGDPYYPDDGNGGYDVTDYAVGISYDPAARRLDGDTTVTARATADLSRFNLDLTGFDVSRVEVDGVEAGTERSGEHELVITPATPVVKGEEFTTRVVYSGEPQAEPDGDLGTNGWQVSTSGGAYAAGEPHSASSWYPVNDHPRDKATFSVRARVPDGWSVVSNGREEPPKPEGGWTTFTWVEPNPVAPYVTTVAIDRWTIVRSTLPGGVPLVDAYAPGTERKRAEEERLPEVLAFLADRFGPYPQSGAGGIFLNENIGFSLEIQGRPIYAKWADLDTIVHEQAHQWYGDSVSVESWADICLNECFASYAQWLWDESANRVDLDARFRATVSKTARNTRYWNRKLYDMGPGNEFTAVYDKGQLAMHALRRRIGEDAFSTLLKRWASTHRDGNASWPQFEDMAVEVSGQADLRPFLTAWFRDAAKPEDRYLFPGTLR
ncbi:M1 family metallopeptidase [Actinokineospora sp. PR83]|uniref:M1 family metallopeptidase n=1 Tax=Actinokineospora sp. PR83 TaxID=2884908 RepID=UPI001F17EDC3|nr:M1 family metallopeptidase [Actinokineospora sp. PR83]MCG8917805.1 M1 family metallopeptidase [Actinokineospora sp. PR83]